MENSNRIKLYRGELKQNQNGERETERDGDEEWVFKEGQSSKLLCFELN